MISKLPDVDWLSKPETQRLLQTLEAAKPGGNRFVGGCVRNTLMRRAVDDIDIATQLLPEDVISALQKSEIRAIPTGIEHGTVTAVVNHVPFEITTLRKDVETDGRRAVVAFTEDWAEDAMRRDFRLNALYAEPDGTIHDPTGGGLDDARDGRIIFIGDADTRLREDYLRILRFFRFNAWYGAGIDSAGLAACERQREGLEQIAAERVWKELKKLLEAPDPRASVAAMAKIDLLVDVFQAVDGASVMSTLIYLEREARLQADPLRRLLAFMPKALDTALSIATKLKMSNKERDRLTDWAAADTRLIEDLSGPKIRAAVYSLGYETLADVVLLKAAGAGGGDIDLALAGLAEARGWEPPDLPVTGQDLVNAGFKSGPLIGKYLADLEAEWIDSDFRMSKSDLLEALEAQLKRD
ncbi:MAG: CCA tRNA nucleotidyltransferase [Pseudomonadota bacterium]